MKASQLLIVAAAALVLSCQWILGLEAPAGRDRGLDLDAAPSDPCRHAAPPPRPSKDDAPDPASQHNYWLGMRTLLFPAAVPDAGTARGLDLDNSCTCQSDLFGGAPTCNTHGALDAGVCDDPGGVDDGLGALVKQYQFAGIDLADRANTEIGNGLHTFLIYIAEYNGQQNDLDVKVAIVPAAGLYTNLDCDGSPRDGGAPIHTPPTAGAPEYWYKPLWDGCDRWTPEPGFVIGSYPTRSALNVVQAYVSGGTLVIPFPEIDDVMLAVFGGNLSFHSAVGMMTIVPEGKGFRGAGFIAGRVAFAGLLDLFGKMLTTAPAGTDIPLCSTSYWQLVPKALCAGRDLMLSPADDRTGQTCNAISGVLGFTGSTVEVAAGDYKPVPPKVECPPVDSSCSGE